MIISHKPNIEKIIRDEGIKLTRTGDCYKALCPWHPDTNPSFVVWPGTQTFKCWGECNVTGDVIAFIQHHKNMSFKQACKYLNVIPDKTQKQLISAQFLNTFESLVKATYQATGSMPTGKDMADFSVVMLPLMLEYMLTEIADKQDRKQRRTNKPMGVPTNGKKR
jgi:DNA primase